MISLGIIPLLKIRRAALALVAAGGLAVGGTGIAQETAAGNPENAILDGTFQGSGKPAGEYLISANSAMGSWKVELGNVGLHIGQYATPVEDAAVIDLNGYRSGSLYQSVTTVPGQTYTVKFHATGNWRTMPWMPRKLSLRFGNEAVSYTVTKPEGWSAENPGWQEYTATFVAQHSKTAVRFSSGSSRIPDGALITNVQLLPPVRLGPDALDTIEVPLPSNLDEFVRDRDLAVVLGKALFWDMQVGSDNRTACATCHWNAGADTRDVNTLHPGATGGTFGQQLAAGKAIELQAQADFRGVNKKLRRQDFPFHQLETPLFPGDEAGFESSENPVVFSTREITGSTGIGEQNFVGLSGCCAVELTYSNQNSLFKIGGKNSRQVTTRNTPSTINAVFFDRTFWDGRANHYFNGVNPFGDLDPDAKVYREAADGRLEKVSVLLDNATLASQAVGPVLSSIEMSAQGRLFSDVARKLFATRPLAMQRVSSNDSVLGEYADAGGYGLHQHKAGYATLIRRAFLPEWWASPDYTEDGYTHMEANFSLFWGLSVMLYEATLVSDESPYDQYARGDYKAMSAAAVEGLRIFVEEGKCISCHHGPEFAGATVSALRNHAADELDPENPVDQMDMKNGEFASYDSGFYNIGVRPTVEDIGIGALHPYLGPLSYTRQEQLGKDPDPAVTVGKDDRVAVMGAFKTPTLRNVELTGPYMHNGGMKSLTEVVEFYVRGGNFPKTNAADLHPDIGEISELQENPQAVSYLVEFLMHLTDERVRYQAAPFDHPELYLPLGHAGVEYGKLLDHIVVLPATGRDGGGRLHSFEETLYGQVSWKNPGGAYPPADPYEDKPVEEYPPADPYVDKPVEEYPPADPYVGKPVEEYPPADPYVGKPVEEYPPADPYEDKPVEEYPPADPYEDKPVEEYPPADPYVGKPVEEYPPADPYEDKPVEEYPPADPYEDKPGKGEHGEYCPEEEKYPAKEKDEYEVEYPKPYAPVKDEYEVEYPEPYAPEKDEYEVEYPEPYAPEKDEYEVEYPKPYAPVKDEYEVEYPEPYAPEKDEYEVEYPEPYAPEKDEYEVEYPKPYAPEKDEYHIQPYPYPPADEYVPQPKKGQRNRYRKDAKDYDDDYDDDGYKSYSYKSKGRGYDKDDDDYDDDGYKSYSYKSKGRGYDKDDDDYDDDGYKSYSYKSKRRGYDKDDDDYDDDGHKSYSYKSKRRGYDKDDDDYDDDGYKSYSYKSKGRGYDKDDDDDRKSYGYSGNFRKRYSMRYDD